jgi:hypothetical protein
VKFSAAAEKGMSENRRKKQINRLIFRMFKFSQSTGMVRFSALALSWIRQR